MIEKEAIEEMSDEEFRLLRDMLHEQSGCFYDDSNKNIFESRLSLSMKRNQLTSFRDYYYLLKYDREKRAAELERMIDIMTIHETYFFREETQLKTFEADILPEIWKKKADTRRLRIWCAGCSTGEEPYTLSMIILENGSFKDWDWEIIATDISPQVLASARKGCYGKNAFRTITQYYLQKYFTRTDDGDFHRINDQVRKNVTFFKLNLFDDAKLAFISDMDLIICRNVIIYFDVEGKKKVVDIFRDKLVDRGFLLLGHSESLMSISNDFSLRHFTYDMVYQKN